MADAKVIAVIPARMGSSRFPGKPLAKIAGLPMIEHVRRRTEMCKVVDEVVVATCDQEIYDLVTASRGKVVMTADTHERCTERVEEAMQSLEGDIVAIVQGDEPLLLPEVVDSVIAPLLRDDTVYCTNLLSPLLDEEDFADPAIVKAALDQNGHIMFFSRASIPYFRNLGSCPIYRQTGIWGLRRAFLSEYVNFSETPFEKVESIDMLRVLENGRRIFGVPMDSSTIGVDHREDVIKVERILKTDAAQQKLLAQVIA